MAESPFTTKPSEKRTSLAEMAARAAQRTSRPPPSPSGPPSSRSLGSMAPRAAGSRAHASPSYVPPSQPYASSPSYAPLAGDEANGSGLINLSHISHAPTLSPAVRAIDPRMAATPVGTVSVRSVSGGSRMVLTGVVVALVGIGVAYGLTSRNGSDSAPERAAAPRESTEAVHPAAVAVPSQPTDEAPATAAPARAAAERVNTPPGTLDPGEATEVTRASVPRAPIRTGKGHKTAGASNNAPAPALATGPSLGAAATAAMAAPAAAPAPPRTAPPAPAAPEPTGLAGAIKKAAGPTEQAPPPEKAEVTRAAPPRGDIPELPAQGAISGALGSPRAAARNCLAGQEAPSRATIVFASSGIVQSVTVSGPAAGTPAEACVKAAMSKTVVGAFKHPTFSVSTTLSPP